MKTDRERLDALEYEVREMRQAIRVAGGASVALLVAAIDQLVDERLLPAATRSEIWGRVRKDISAIRIGSRDLADGMDQAIPSYRTVEDRAVMAERQKRVQKEILALRTGKPSKGQADG